MKRELLVFFTALSFYTRLPVPKWAGYSQEYLNESMRYFPLIGWIIGGICALVFYLSSFIFSSPVSIILSMLAGFFSTGAFHEDGLTDTCDAFGGGWKREDVLLIMKDSRIGTYGALGLTTGVLLKFFALLSIPAQVIPVVLVMGHSVSRFLVTLMKFFSRYVTEEAQAKSYPMIEKMTPGNLMVASIFGVVPLCLLGGVTALFLLIPGLLMTLVLGKYFTRRIGGYTGDCLGATQQITEILFYLSFIVLWRFI